MKRRQEGRCPAVGQRGPVKNNSKAENILQVRQAK